ncbi:MAG: glycosyltransferase family 4 protein [Anaerolineales bacterium]|nr:glycosyltransferase family 4 protein [Anaerolineales bacterium]
MTTTSSERTEPFRIVINGWFAGDFASGSGQYTDHLLEWLPRIAPQTRFLLLLPASHSITQQEAAARWPGVEPVFETLPPLPANVAKLWWEQVIAPRATGRLHGDVLWVPYWAGPWRSPAPVVVTIHDLIPLLLPAYRGGMLQRGYTRLVSATVRRATAIIAVSEASKRDIVEQLGIPASQVWAVHHGPNQEGHSGAVQAASSSVREKYGLPAHYFLYLGGFDVRKNVKSTIAAYRRYLDRGGDPEIKLVIAGKLPGESSEFFPDPRLAAQRAGVESAVFFCGWIDEADKPALYALATAYIFPSLYEGFGMMVLEAMQAGTPVITSL